MAKVSGSLPNVVVVVAFGETMGKENSKCSHSCHPILLLLLLFIIIVAANNIIDPLRRWYLAGWRTTFSCWACEVKTVRSATRRGGKQRGRRSLERPTENMDTIILRGINLNTPTNGFLGTINLWWKQFVLASLRESRLTRTWYYGFTTFQ